MSSCTERRRRYLLRWTQLSREITLVLLVMMLLLFAIVKAVCPPAPDRTDSLIEQHPLGAKESGS